MPDEAEIRRMVTKNIAEAGAANVAAMVAAADSSRKKRAELRAKRQKEELNKSKGNEKKNGSVCVTLR